MEVPQHVLDYLGEEKTMTLATASGDGQPHAATLLYVNDGVDLFAWLKLGSTTAAHLEQNPRVSFAIDRYSDDFRQTKGIQATAECVPVTGDELAKAAMLFGDKYPALSPGGSTASIAFYRIRPSELQFIDNSGAEKHRDEFAFDFHSDQIIGA